MFEKLTAAGERCAADAVVRTINRLAKTSTPPGVQIEPIEGGIALTGKALRRRYISDPNLRNFAR
ncbi:MAG: hypothetical protein ABI668_11340 [Sphingorhabdus sp.]